MRNSENATLVALLVGVFFTCWPLLVFLYQKVEGSEVANGSLGQTFLFCLVFVPPLGFSAWCWNLIRRKRSPVWSGLHTPALLLLLAQIGLVVVLLVLSSPAP